MQVQRLDGAFQPDLSILDVLFHLGPGAADYQVPPELRQDLLEAMKGRVPPAYKDKIQIFYEELVK